MSGGKNTFFTSWLKSAHPGYKPDEELGLTKVGPYLFLFRLAWTSRFSLFFCVLCPLRKYESLALEYWNIELRTTFGSFTNQLCAHLTTLLPNWNASDTLTVDTFPNLANHVHDGADFLGTYFFVATL